jgi:glycosyltransferase involved in cell wall biosynthesis
MRGGDLDYYLPQDSQTCVVDSGWRKIRRLLRELGADAALRVQSSVAETFGCTVIEAMAFGVSVLTAPGAKATPEALADTERHCESKEIEAAKDIHVLLRDEALYGARVAKGLARARGFSYDLEVGRLVEIFHRVCGAISALMPLPVSASGVPALIGAGGSQYRRSQRVDIDCGWPAR